MWKITIKYRDNSQCIIKGKQKDIPLELAEQYYRQFNCSSKNRTAIYQKYPIKNNEPISLIEKIDQLREERGYISFEEAEKRILSTIKRNLFESAT